MKELEIGRRTTVFLEVNMWAWKKEDILEKHVQEIGSLGFRDQPDVTAYPCHLRSVVYIGCKIIQKVKEVESLNSVFFKKSAYSPYCTRYYILKALQKRQVY